MNSVASSKQINNSPLNTSQSKNLYSFPKESRFKHETIACDRMYELPSLHPSKYGVGIGRGNKSDFTRDRTVSPPVSKYTRMSFFDENKKRNRGCSIALGRDVRMRIAAETQTEQLSGSEQHKGARTRRLPQ